MVVIKFQKSGYVRLIYVGESREYISPFVHMFRTLMLTQVIYVVVQFSSFIVIQTFPSSLFSNHFDLPSLIPSLSSFSDFPYLTLFSPFPFFLSFPSLQSNPTISILSLASPLSCLLLFATSIILGSKHHHHFLKNFPPTSHASSVNSDPSPHPPTFPCTRIPSAKSSISYNILIIPVSLSVSLAAGGRSADGKAKVQISFSRTEAQGMMSKMGWWGIVCWAGVGYMFWGKDGWMGVPAGRVCR